MANNTPKKLKLKFHGRVIDHLGIQMYQSPVAAIAELISNSWDADADKVEITLPAKLGPSAEIVIKDDGNGMTFGECQDRYLNVGYDCREGVPAAKSAKNRPVLGRKGIGKFAGFGIAQRMVVETISGQTGERTIFDLKLSELRGSDYIEQGGDVSVTEYAEPSEELKAKKGTTITLHDLSLKRAQNRDAFARSMSRRFLLAQRAEDFTILVNGYPIPSDSDLDTAQFVFPRDYEEKQRPDKLTEIDADGWGTEGITGGRSVRWRFHFYPEPIQEEELRGISIFANGKLAQRPFMFHITGGISGQQGLEYLSGRVEADYIDAQEKDLIATERQRINWEDESAIPLLEWGAKRIEELCRIWKERRAADKLKILEDKLDTFGGRLNALPHSEQVTVRKALSKLAQISSLTSKQFEDLGNAILTSWEAGRLKELINNLSNAHSLDPSALIGLLVEANVLTALNAFEAVKTKVALIEGLKERIEQGELENAVRDYIATNPWLIAPEWETFRKETSVRKVIQDIIADKKIDPEREWGRRIDLILGSGDTLLLIEFMQPGKSLDYDHLNRFNYYIDSVRSYLNVNTAFQYRRCIGYLVAGSLAKDSALGLNIQTSKKDEKYALDWTALLATAEKKYEEFIEILRERSPADMRLKDLKTDDQPGVS